VAAYVDGSGDGTGDHFILGYDDRDDGLYCAAYNTWHESETIDWNLFGPNSPDYSFGINSLAYVHPLD
jgi:hypothetical protein